VKDNQPVQQGELLFVIDPRPYEFALARARADVAALDGEIHVTKRKIQGQRFAVAAAAASVQRMAAQLKVATDSLHRLEPLLPKQFVTPDKIDQARTSQLTAAAALDEARRKKEQAEKDVGDLVALRAKRDAALAARGKAELDLGFCWVRAPFDALVVNLHTSIGAFVSPGPVPVFSLVDSRCASWPTIARPKLVHIAPGMEAEVCTCSPIRSTAFAARCRVTWA
jgi:multidrug efflux system membrane fusion protein